MNEKSEAMRIVVSATEFDNVVDVLLVLLICFFPEIRGH
jgi:hypothetical protein